MTAGVSVPGWNRNAWRERAACRSGPELDWITPTAESVATCRAICATCPVLSECRTYALQAGEPWGIWGGLDPDERAELAAGLNCPPPTVLPSHGTNSRYAWHGCRCIPCRTAHTNYVREHRKRLQK